MEGETYDICDLTFVNYEASSMGRVRRVGSAHDLTQWGKGGRHSIVTLCKSKDEQLKILVHKLVSTAFLERPDGQRYINHIDGDTRSNALSNATCSRSTTP